MIRLLFTIIAGVLLGGVVHLVSVLALPRIATQDAYSRLAPMTKVNAVTPLPLAEKYGMVWVVPTIAADGATVLASIAGNSITVGAPGVSLRVPLTLIVG